MNKPITTALTQRESPDKAQKDKILAMPACDYMNDEQLAFFRQRLLDERYEIQAHLKEMKRQSLLTNVTAMKPIRPRLKRSYVYHYARPTGKAAW